MSQSMQLARKKEDGNYYSKRRAFNVKDSLFINFFEDKRTSEYVFTFINDKDYTYLSFTFLTDLKVDCYFKYVKKEGNPMFFGFAGLKNEEKKVYIKDCSEVSIFIPRYKNKDVCTVLTLATLYAS